VLSGDAGKPGKPQQQMTQPVSLHSGSRDRMVIIVRCTLAVY
jgi:hypothetical protein